jgi:hypothetical protein
LGHQGIVLVYSDVVAAEFHFVAQAYGAIEHIAFVEVVENAFELCIAELDPVVLFKFSFEVDSKGGGVSEGDRFVT